MKNIILMEKKGAALIARISEDCSVKEYIVASGFDPKDGTWRAGKYYGADSLRTAERDYEMATGTNLKLKDIPEYVRRNNLDEFSVTLGDLIIYLFERSDADFEYTLLNVRGGISHEVESGVLEADSITDAYRELAGCFTVFSDPNAEAKLYAGAPDEVS